MKDICSEDIYMEDVLTENYSIQYERYLCK
jgi:hypothetical protein